jgi:hypothetical protein
VDQTRDFTFGYDLFGFYPINPGAYFSAVDAFGSPAYTLPELAESPSRARDAADRRLVAALEIELGRARRGDQTARCRVVRASPAGGAEVPIRPGTFTLRARSPGTELRLGRFADEPRVDLGRLPRGRPASLEIPPDRSPRRWRVAVRGRGPVTLCRAGSR